MRPIPDRLQSNLKILFVGFNPSIRSSETGHHYANPNNRFYRILHQAGLTPRLYRPEEDTTLIELGYGFTNIVARPTKEAAEITKEEYEQGRKELRSKIETHKPQTVCFVGKGVYEQYSLRKNIPWGVQENPVVEGVVEFVAPSSSGLVRMAMSDVVDIYRGLLPIIGSSVQQR
ncbi:mismatch-specific DNA-glycosylase [Brevibacillus sp. SYSU BS000544]|uniref:mismatch-specific DNA-glycosylase n=1 Tax=Brevibacillus sp. SYSU BS000544 TaxID=3416443 RepID=UPI003CE55156